MMMKKILIPAISAIMLLTGCSSVPVTGRRQLNLVSDNEVLSASLTEYQSYMKTAKKSTNAEETAQVVRVGKRIAAATEEYLKTHGAASEISEFSWEFNLVQNNELNAFCMPGGKIVVYEGLMKIISKDDELAVVLGHEVAHAVAKHSNERMSQQLVAQYGAGILGQALSGQSQAVQAIASQVYGLGANYGVILPFSRKHESEADKIGLVFMRLAGYDPEVAVSFWKKMSASSSSSVPEFASTHPSDARRISDIEKALPAIMKDYQPLPEFTSTGSKTTSAATKTLHFSSKKKSSSRKRK
jgi:predicted Zn-dependent protease